MPLTLNRYGAGLQLHLGVPSEPETVPPPSRAYLDAVLSLPLLQEQGDGVRSFVGLLLHSMVKMPLVLIDEPEAFLHPPHARLLGRVLVERTTADEQLIIATHSDDVLQGVLEVRDRPIHVIRLTREGDRAIMRTLDPAAIRRLWADPLVRHSQLLDGLFHDAVLVCESDADCRFYAAVFDELIGNDFGPALLVTHVGGKQRLAKAVRAVVQFGLHVGVIADLDMLADSAMLADLVRALGGSWTAFEQDHRIVASNVTGIGRAPEIGDSAANSRCPPSRSDREAGQGDGEQVPGPVGRAERLGGAQVGRGGKATGRRRRSGGREAAYQLGGARVVPCAGRRVGALGDCGRWARAGVG
jgi:AAA domain, putative AbiEii toxin, Type IV TA system